MSRHDELMACHRRLLSALRDQMRERKTSKGMEWVAAERVAITQAANQWANAHGLPMVTVDDVKQVERSALGHSDYATKFALYVAERLYAPPVRTTVQPDTPAEP